MYLESRSKRIHERGSSDQTEGNAPKLHPPVMAEESALVASPPTTPSTELQTEADRGLSIPEASPSSPGSVPARTATSPAHRRQTSLQRKPVPHSSSRRPPDSKPTLRPAPAPQYSSERPPRVPPSPRLTVDELNERRRYDRIKLIFRPLDDYLVATFGNWTTLNASFSTIRPPPPGRARSESHITTPPPELANPEFVSGVSLDQLDAKTLLLGDIGENGSWWTGKIGRHPSHTLPRKKVGSESRKPVTSRSPNINWTQLAAWYGVVHSAGTDWQRQLEHLREASFRSIEDVTGATDIQEIDNDLREAREHTVRTLLKITENILKRPGSPLKEPEHLRFLFIILSNPSLYPQSISWPRGIHSSHALPGSPAAVKRQDASLGPNSSHLAGSPQKQPTREANQHNGLVKRIFGLLANTPDTCHRYVVGWLSRLDEEHFTSLVDLCTMFVNYRISRRSSRPADSNHLADGGLIPDLSGGAMSTSAQLHSAMGLSGSVKKRADESSEPEWTNDWQVKTAAKVMSLLFAANNIWQGRRKIDNIPRVDSGNSVVRPQDRVRRSGQLLQTSNFYNTLLDYHDLIADFKVWESKKEKFAFCQYPLFLSMGAKTKILEYDARRQMEIKAREAIFDQVIRQRAIDGQFHLKVRRDCMVDDSLRQISEAVGSGQEELKKGLRVHFAGEEGVDAGGLRKEWFLMLAREVFDADHGLFVYDEQSRTCYFNPHTFETSDQFYLVGALLGLAIYNSTILDIALPSFAFRKLLAAAPAGSVQGSNLSSLTGIKGQMTYTVADLAEYKPSLASGLQQLLDFDGDVESTYCWSFVTPVDKFGTITEVPLMPGGENIPVTNTNRAEFVEAYVRYVLDTAVARQFEPFKRGFFTVCAGNALSLFRAEEIELLIRGSDETLDVRSVKAVAVHENWREAAHPHTAIANPAEDVAVVRWFWEAFELASVDMQRKLLTFITSSDRIPAVGATSLVLRIVAGGDGWSGKDSAGRSEEQRFPVARTCFNMLVLWQYRSREQLERQAFGGLSRTARDLV
ncbi:hypothetical protein AMS68_002833 [Peltaster fructicola]|uniref:HECT-type E3 ubiquitin transferase n=1 Tax=Peltaster fructicola TaxID=286661 RepID=A0A6H0XRJ9_9PEZI|nr:hypothetical protein AMS68_002833 [Peltaster fructicola]